MPPHKPTKPAIVYVRDGSGTQPAIDKATRLVEERGDLRTERIIVDDQDGALFAKAVDLVERGQAEVIVVPGKGNLPPYLDVADDEERPPPRRRRRT